MVRLLKWQEEFIREIKSKSTLELLDDTLNDAAGDDYDGYFTSRGLWKFNKESKELRERIKNLLSIT